MDKRYELFEKLTAASMYHQNEGLYLASILQNPAMPTVDFIKEFVEKCDSMNGGQTMSNLKLEVLSFLKSDEFVKDSLQFSKDMAGVKVGNIDDCKDFKNSLDYIEKLLNGSFQVNKKKKVHDLQDCRSGGND